ncbi:MAG TPA: NADH-ubiquinone oxidoreductase-F iron-sulfur binding region domain-containing protein [Acidimicrobiales bacterium]|nr:NADH-ubiquinone oxidoreductase-F iron-sulfur binding region domain-containing protein [Acidimicrobiales bacterium]
MTPLDLARTGAGTEGASRAGTLAILGGRHARLLAGPERLEGYDEHLARLGGPIDLTAGEDLAAEIERSGLRGRGGGYFPLARKLEVARRSPGQPVVVVNATEGEPAIRKDRLLLSHRPHLVLDGAEALAAAVGADLIYVAVHEHRPETGHLEAAAAARPQASTRFRFVATPDRYIAGESSALVSWINGGPPRPTGRIRPSAVSGVGGRPTVVSNAETAAHVALIARFGAEWFGEAVTPGGPGSALLTVAGDVGRPGTVVELTGSATIGQIVAAAGGPTELPRALLIGGYTGRWIPAHDCWGKPLATVLSELDAPIGCGLIGVMGSRRCGLVETSRLVGWLAGQRAGQCGSCDLGLPVLAETFALVADGARGRRRAPAQIVSLGQSLTGRGLCGLPDGVVSMVESSMQAFAQEMALHRKRRCSGEDGPPVFPLPGRKP